MRILRATGYRVGAATHQDPFQLLERGIKILALLFWYAFPLPAFLIGLANGAAYSDEHPWIGLVTGLLAMAMMFVFSGLFTRLYTRITRGARSP